MDAVCLCECVCVCVCVWVNKRERDAVCRLFGAVYACVCVCGGGVFFSSRKTVDGCLVKTDAMRA